MANVEGGDVRIDPIDAWLQAAMADAERRNLPQLRPLLESVARSTRQLRAAEWNDYVPTGGTGPAEARSAKAEGGLVRRSAKREGGKAAGRKGGHPESGR
jgi:hypothetical protein